MRIVPINEAEAIIEPFWDGGSSENPTDKYSVLSEYAVKIEPETCGAIRQNWYYAEVGLEAGQPGKIAASMSRTCELGIDEYDVFRVFAAIPDWISLSVKAVIDGKEALLIEDYQGINTNDEIDGMIKGKCLTHLELSFKLLQNRPGCVELKWLGLSSLKAQRRMEAKKSRYSSEWKEMIKPEPGEFSPSIGIYFGKEDLSVLRQRVKKGPIKMIMDNLRKQAEEDMKLCPENEIDYFVPFPDRFCRKRDMKRNSLMEPMERLAFVGLLDERPEMSRMAVRMAIAISMCNTWCESIIGMFPGATWHHRSFTEESYSRACALVLDWAGFYITPHGQQVIRDAIIMKGLPRIESDFKRMEYIRHMNQGIVFSVGRIIGALSLLPAYPRYKSLIEEAEKDLLEMIGNYIQKDGGTLEGMAYWNFTFANALPLLYVMSRYRKMQFKEYIPWNVAQTGDYALGMLSTTEDGATYLPINDAHSGDHLNLGLIMCYSRISENRTWKDLCRSFLKSGNLKTDIQSILFYTDEMEEEQKGGFKDDASSIMTKPGFFSFPYTGQVSLIREDAALKLVHYHFCSGPTYLGHYHEDKGSFILEANGEVLAMDRGVTDYDHPEVMPIIMAGRHNLLYPENDKGFIMHQPAGGYGGELKLAEYRQGTLLLVSNQEKAWEAGLFKKNIRRVVSPEPWLYIIDDEVEMNTAWKMSFRVNTSYDACEEENGMRIDGSRSSLRILPLNWCPQRKLAGREGLDCHLKPVNLIRLETGKAIKHRLITVLEVLPEGIKNSTHKASWSCNSNCTANLNYGEFYMEIDYREEGRLKVALNYFGKQPDFVLL
jgi:hypothetical protein